MCLHFVLQPSSLEVNVIQSIKRFFGITPNVYNLPYNERIYVIALSTAVERVR
jgi:hypothetical protein